MKIKEFAHKNAMVFFYTTLALLVAILLILIVGFNRDRIDRFDKRSYDRRGMMKTEYNDNYSNNRRGSQMMYRQQLPINNASNTPIQEPPLVESNQ